MFSHASHTVCLGAQLKFALDDSSAAFATSAVVRDAQRRPVAKGKGVISPKGRIPDVGGMVGVQLPRVLCSVFEAEVNGVADASPLLRRVCVRFGFGFGFGFLVVGWWAAWFWQRQSIRLGPAVGVQAEYKYCWRQ